MAQRPRSRSRHQNRHQQGQRPVRNVERLERRDLLSINSPLLPIGSQAYEELLQGTIASAGERDSFTLSVDGGQSLSASVTPALGSALQTTVSLFDPAGQLLVTATAAAGAPVALGPVDAATAGDYSLVVEGAASSTGAYSTRVLLNAGFESESFGGTRNGNAAVAESIEGLFRPVGVGEAAVVVGLGESANLFRQTRSVTGGVVSPNVIELDFTAAPPAAGDAIVRVTATADLGSTSEFLAVNAEGLFTTNIFVNDGGEGVPRTTQFTIPAAAVAQLAADGVVRLSFTPSSFVGNLSATSLSAELEYPLVSGPGSELEDWLRFSLDDGELASVALNVLPASSQAAVLEVYSPDGPRRIATIPAGGGFSRFADALGNTTLDGQPEDYLLRVVTTGEYTLVVTRDAALDAEPNDGAAESQGLGGRSTAIGAVIGGLAGAVDSPGPAVPLPLTLLDGAGFRWDVGNVGEIFDGTNDAYDGGLILGGFPFRPSAGTEQGERELILGPAPIPQFQGAVTAERRIYVPPNAGFARYLETFTNTGSTTVTPTVTVSSNLGSNGSTQRIATSSGDLSFTTADDWLVTDDFNGSGDPTLAHVVAGDGERPVSVSLSGDILSFSYGLTLAPGESRSILHYAVQAVDQSIATATANDLRALRGGALAGLSSVELARVANWSLRPADADRYGFVALAGAQVTVTANAPSAGPLDFSNALDVALEVTAPSGAVIPHTLSAGDESLTFTAPESGEYSVRLSGEGSTTGEYVLTIVGADTTPDAFTVVSSTPADGAGFNSASLPTRFDVTLSAPLDLRTVSSSDLVVTGSGGSLPARAVSVTGPSSLSFTLPTLTDGANTISIAQGALTSLAGTPLSAFGATLSIDSTGPRVVGASVTPGQLVSTGPFDVVVTFNEPILASSLSTSTVRIIDAVTGSSATTSVFSLDSTGRQLTVSVPSLPEGAYALRLLSGRSGIRDLVGNELDGEAPAGPLPPGVSGDGLPGGEFQLAFQTEAGPTPFTAPLAPVAPLGSLTHRGQVSSSVVNATDVDRFTLPIDPNQTFTAIVRPSATLAARLEVSFAGNPLTASAVSSGPGGIVLLRNLPTLGGGELRLDVSSADGSAGAYTLELLLNADFELATLGISGGDSLATAQSLDPSFGPIGTLGADRAAVVGVTQQPGGNFSVSRTLQGNVFAPNVLTASLAAPQAPLGGGTLRVRALADLDTSFEFLALNLEGLFSTNLFVSGGLQGSVVEATFALSAGLLSQLLADGVLGATITPSGDVNDLGFSTFVELTLSYPVPTGAEADWYRFTLDADELATIAVGGGASVSLFDSAGQLLATGEDRLGDLTAIDRFTHRSPSGAAEEFYVAVSGGNAPYQLLVTRGATFDLEPNDGGALLQPIEGGALGRVDSGSGGSTGGTTSIETLQTFAGPPAGGSIPPDPIAAAGPTHVVALVNTEIAIYDKATGAQTFRQSLNGPGGFFGSAGATTVVFDPWVLFDTASQRFFAIGIDITGSRSNLFLAVSKTSTPTTGDDWFKYRSDFTDFPTTLGSGAHFPDYPKLGVSEDAIWVSGNYFPIDFGSGVYAGITGFDKASLLSGGPLTQVYRETFSGFSVMPMTQYGAAGAMYFAEASTGGGSTIQVHRIDGAPGALVRTVNQLAVSPFQAPPDIPELGGGQPVDSIDARILTGVWRNGSMWFAHGIADPAVGDGEALVRWYEVDTTAVASGGAPSLVQSGNVDPGPGVHAWIPAVAVDGGGNLGIGFALGGTDRFYGAGYTARLAGDAPGTTIAPVVQYVQGLGPYSLSDGSRIRWGDYSGISVDPADDSTFWVFNEYATAGNNWATQFASFRVQVPVDEDHYTIHAAAGDVLRIEARALSAGPGEFVNPLDVELTLLAPDGTTVPYSNRVGDERLFTVAAQAGAYTLVVRGSNSAGTYFVQVERPTGAEPAVSVVGAAPLAGARVATFPTTVTLNFSEQLLVPSVEASDLLIGGRAATAVRRVDADTYEFTIDPAALAGDGVYAIELADGAVLDLQQRGNARYATSFTFDTTGPRVVDVFLNNAPLRFSRVYTEGTVILKAVFDEPLLELESPRRGPFAPGPTDVVVRELGTNTTTFATAVAYDAATLTLTAEFAPFLEGDYVLTLISGDGAFEDVVGNDLDGEPVGFDGTTSGNGVRGGDYTLAFSVDRSSIAAPTFAPVAPLGGLVYQSATAQGVVNVAGDQDVFEFFATGGQSLSAVVTPLDPAASVSVEVVGVASRATSPTAGAPAALSAVPLPFGAVYEVRVTGDRKTSYRLDLVLNAAAEAAVGDSNDLAPVALDGSLFSVLSTAEGGISRWAALGRSDAIPSNNNLLTNGGFETGSFAGWSAVTTGRPFSPWRVTSGGTSTWPTFAPTAPQEGFFSAVNGFDGTGPMEFRLDQVVSLPSTTAPLRLTWADRAQWDFSLGNVETIGRQSIVEALDPTSGEVLASLSAFATGAQATNLTGDTGWVRRSADLSQLAGRDVRLRFRQVVPLVSTGPGQYEIDDIRLTVAGASTGADRDVYSIDLTSYAGQTVEVALAGRGRALTSSLIELIDSQGVVVASGTPSTQLGGGAINGFVVPSSGGVYSVVVTSVDPGDYTLLVTAGGVIEREPNSEASSSGVTRVGRGVGALGYLNPSDTDVHLTPLAQGQSVIASISAVLTRDGSAAVSSRLRLLDPSGAVVSEAVAPAGGSASVSGVAGVTGDYRLEVTHLSGEGEYVVSVTRSTLRGDFNGDGLVNTADYSFWRDLQGTDPGLSLADGDRDGDIDLDDAAIWRANFGLTEATATPGDWLPLPGVASAPVLVAAAPLVAPEAPFGGVSPAPAAIDGAIAGLAGDATPLPYASLRFDADSIRDVPPARRGRTGAPDASFAPGGRAALLIDAAIEAPSAAPEETALNSSPFEAAPLEVAGLDLLDAAFAEAARSGRRPVRAALARG